MSSRNIKNRITKEELDFCESLDLKALEEEAKISIEECLKAEYTFDDYLNLFIRQGFDRENATILATKHFNKLKMLKNH